MACIFGSGGGGGGGGLTQEQPDRSRAPFGEERERGGEGRTYEHSTGTCAEKRRAGGVFRGNHNLSSPPGGTVYDTFFLCFRKAVFRLPPMWDSSVSWRIPWPNGAI